MDGITARHAGNRGKPEAAGRQALYCQQGGVSPGSHRGLCLAGRELKPTLRAKRELRLVPGIGGLFVRGPYPREQSQEENLQ